MKEKTISDEELEKILPYIAKGNFIFADNAEEEILQDITNEFFSSMGLVNAEYSWGVEGLSQFQHELDAYPIKDEEEAEVSKFYDSLGD